MRDPWWVYRFLAADNTARRCHIPNISIAALPDSIHRVEGSGASVEAAFQPAVAELQQFSAHEKPLAVL